jgi:LPS sulfotransferase NodH
VLCELLERTGVAGRRAEQVAQAGIADERAGEPPVPSMRRQSGQQSREWAERYRREEEAHR